jgi:hypothetical protein
MGKRRNKFVTIISLTGIIIIAGLVFGGSAGLEKGTPVRTDLAYEAKGEIPLQKSKVDIISPDGKFTLIVEEEREKDVKVSQKFYITSEKVETPIMIYENVSAPESMFSVPINTFSPDNKYIFLKYEESGKDRYIVVRTDSEDIKPDTKTVEIVELFSEKQPDYVITDVTGWGSYSLIVVNTDTVAGNMGPSWWFDVSNFSFIRLSSRFN